MEKLLTISVAAYNIEKYLEQALSSLADEDYVNQLEVFVVDDGGTDRSLEIAREYEKQFPGTFHAVHKENGGYGSTVNYSMAHASGKYFKLLDGDDWMDKEGLRKVLKILGECEEDIVLADYYIGPSEDELIICTDGQYSSLTADLNLYNTGKPHGMWAIFYKTELLKKINFTLPEHCFYTDEIYSTIPFGYGKKIRFVDTPVYCYRTEREGQSTSKKAKLKNMKDWFRVRSIVFDFYKKHGRNRPYLLTRVTRYYVLTIKLFLLLPPASKNKKRLIRFEKNMKSRYPDIYRNAEKSNNMGRFIHALRKTNYHLYWIRTVIPDRYLI